LLGRAALGKDATTIHVRVKARDADWRVASITVSPLCAHATPRFGVAIWLSDQDEGADLDRMARLEAQLLQLAADMRAGALTVPVGTTYVDINGLSERQTDVIRRFAQGQRVPSIARDLFLSPSTVRNHLSAIYRKLGVSSQFELMEKLRG
jgi:DNA-binding CsgD family transcriptional regulator